MGGTETTTEEIIKDIRSTAGITGVTISGGDPFFQYEALLDLCKKIRQQTALDIWVYTGFEEEEIVKLYPEILSYVDALVLGKFIQEEKTSSLPYIGSKNQRVIYF